MVKKVANLKELNGSSVFISWRRGTSKVQGETTHTIVRNGEATFEEKISFESKFFIDAKTQKPDEKKLSMSLKEEKKKSSSGKVLGKIELDLTSYMNYKTTQIVNLSFTKGIKPEPQITPLVKVLNKDTVSKDPRLVKTISGEDYFLDKTDSASDTTVDTSQITDMSVDSFGDDDINDDLGESKKELRQQIDQITKEKELAENEADDRLQRMKDMETEIENLKKQNKILHDDIADKERLIESYQVEKDDLINQQMMQSSRALSDSNGVTEVDMLKQEKLEKMTVIANQEKEIAKLKKQVKQNQLSNSEIGSLTGTDLRGKYTALQQENEEMEKMIARLEKENAELQEKLNVGITTKKRSDSFNGGNSANDIGVVTKSGSVDELRRQSLAYKQELDEKTLIERTIFLAEPQFKGTLSVSGINLFDGLVAQGILKDAKSGSRIFSSISTAFETTLKKCINDNNMLAYWLSTSCLLLAKIESSQGYAGSEAADKAGLSPISSFEYQLKTTIFKFYSRLIQNTYAKISPVLIRSILQHEIHAFNSGRLLKRKSASDIPTSPSINNNNNTASPTAATTRQQNHHQHHSIFNSNSLLDILEEMHDILRQNYVHSNLVGQFFSQVFFFTNALLLNSLNSIHGLCSTANGFQMKIEISKVQDWVAQVNLTESIVQMQQMIEVTNLLVMDKKLISDADVLEQVIPSMQPHHVKHLLTLFQTDQINSDPIPSGLSKAIDQIINKSGEQSPQTFDIDLTYMNQLSLDFLKDSSYRASDRRDTAGRNNAPTNTRR
ncbi:hypothetical protein SAMD00019534_124940 [Acytostelium subglobosum LB1]|uniref:hypothetical protein n=1 Tax=Acytostelium subglobosum LB1 TaxID=1410327 RepID=UPI0006451E25|nr:hypothetical protein SAMD00019534_124940 [Acytostelium subglobosum LB1]GAM29318.1 hypothetical protein SAMD00019534_124940 [Acytostelium subglobosum LB1]|eukprot:XP_012747745.1 hypothetical protein SAMD00019534_124940 [Acytostelium subglobosum LB1]